MTPQEQLAVAKSKMNALFATLCASLGIAPTYVSLSSRCGASFLSEREANVLADLLRRANVEPEIHHWSAVKDPDFDRDEWQVCWTL